MPRPKLQAPFPYFGGKSAVAHIVWQALGDVDHYIEPFFGSGAVLLARDNWENKTEMINDKDGFVTNFWRAVKWAPEQVAKFAEWPLNHIDLIARRKYVAKHRQILPQCLMADYSFCDPKLAGFWVWIMSAAIGKNPIQPSNSIPHCADKGRGIFAARSKPLLPYIERLHTRMKDVRVICGEWDTALGGNWQNSNWINCGIFLDPPYGIKAKRSNKVYQEDDLTIAEKVQIWALQRGEVKDYRIVLAGYYEEHAALLTNGWAHHGWNANGGWGNLGQEGNSNRKRETLFFSPHCLPVANSEAALQPAPGHMLLASD